MPRASAHGGQSVLTLPPPPSTRRAVEGVTETPDGDSAYRDGGYQLAALSGGGGYETIRGDDGGGAHIHNHSVYCAIHREEACTSPHTYICLVCYV